MAASVLDVAGIESTGMLANSRLDFSLNPQGDFKDVEDRKHRAVYETLADSDQKLQYYSARQIGCRLLGSRGYLCQKVAYESLKEFSVFPNAATLVQTFTELKLVCSAGYQWRIVCAQNLPLAICGGG